MKTVLTNPAFFLPGMHGTAALWTRYRQFWSGSFSAVSYDDEADQTIDDYARVAEAAISAAYPDMIAVDLIAESFSGPVALRVAQHGRVRVRSIVLVASFAGRWPSCVLSAIRVLPLRRMGWLHPPTKALTAVLLNGVTDRTLIAEVIGVARTIPPRVLAGRLRLLAKLDVGAWRCPHPVLYLQATHDRLVGSGAMLGIRQVCAALTVVAIEGPHLLMQARPSQCADAIGAFLARDLPA